MGKYAIISWNISCYGGRNMLPYLKESNFANIFYV